MLLELSIRDFAIIDRLHLELSPAFNVLTGETGAGKSIIIDALGTLRGEKADPTMVRSGSTSARVEGVFSLHDCSEVLPLLQEYGLVDDDDQLIVVREINAQTGRSVARVNGRAVNNATLREIGGRLVDIHGQHEGASLFNTRTHIDILDRYANLLPLRAEVAAVVDQLRDVRAQLAELHRSAARRQDRIEELQYQIDEIEAAKLRVGEEEELSRERKLLQNAAKITTLANSVYAQLAAGEEGRRGKEPILDSLSAAVSSIDELQRYDPSLAAVLEQANDLLYRLEDLVAAMRDYRDNLDFDPGRMEQIEERFLLLRTLQRKYGGTVAEMLAGAEAAAVELHRLTHSAEHMADLQAREDELLAQLAQLAGELSRRRRAAGDELAARIVQSTSDLAMPHVKFAVLIEQLADERDGVTLDGGPAGDRIAFDRTGVDRVEFMLAPNPGEPLKPLARISSGGESARLLLAIKSILSMVDTVPTLVFDEVDVGVGGRAGGVVGEKLWGMTANHQVICITHLPQVAAFADTHYTIAKQVDAGRTRSTVEPLDQDRRVDEIAAMLDGVPITDASRSTARTMLDRSRAYKKTAATPEHPAPAARQAEPRLSSLAT
ncbi:MAG TPA: DNA repair protein RecN [Herpetosiphonaceae bacterium]|nr:DNA repair protein RecN [Herpetosiphonaceae bacterium]